MMHDDCKNSFLSRLFYFSFPRFSIPYYATTTIVLESQKRHIKNYLHYILYRKIRKLGLATFFPHLYRAPPPTNS